MTQVFSSTIASSIEIKNEGERADLGTEEMCGHVEFVVPMAYLLEISRD